MSFIINPKEDLHLQMVELHEKLLDSEKERKKLERTCEALIRAFREEQRMHFNNLNIKYEKFIEDYNIRRRRNEIILKSLCRVESRAKAIFAKTERLKLLKERYTSYLKQNDFIKESQLKLREPKKLNEDEVVPKSVHWKTPNLADVQEFISKDFSHLNESIVKPLKEGELEKDDGHKYSTDSSKENILDKNDSNSDELLQIKSLNEQLLPFNALKELSPKTSGHFQSTPLYVENKTYALDNSSSTEQPFQVSVSQGTTIQNHVKGEHNNEVEKGSKKEPDKQLSFQNTSFGNYNPSYRTPSLGNIQKSNERCYPPTIVECRNSDSNLKQEPDMLKPEIISKKGKLMCQDSVDKFEESFETFKEKQKEKIPTEIPNHKLENEGKIDTIIEKEELETSEKKGSVIKNFKDNFINFEYLSSSPTKKDFEIKNNDRKKTVEDTVLEVEKNDFEGDNSESDITGNTENDLPKGLDGVDYENETYPECYYEQPVRSHSYSNIISNVILEEDEYEYDVNQPENDDHNNSQMSNSKQNSNQTVNIGNKNSDVLLENLSLREREFLEETCNNKNPNENANAHKTFTSKSSLSETHSSQDSDSENKYPEEKNNDSFTNQYDVSKTELKKDEDERLELGISLPDKFKSLTNSTKSNLVQLLESDSESFQIEHGQVASGNEDSDFDFSFH